MKKLIIPLLAVLAAITSCKQNSSEIGRETPEIMPVTGTWINLAWQDERNNYMNFQDENINTDPEMWTDKMIALHEIGVDWVMFDQVANDRKAYYPSDIMEHHYPDGRKDPVTAVMDACDSLGMHVFLSCGWAVDQYDDVGDSSVVARQCEIMTELAALYGDRPSFDGWYLPMEDCLIPYLPDRSIAGINRLTATAYRITPGKLTMVAPYGIFGADLDNPKFAANLDAINVDIIAYQDEIGCVRDIFPMAAMKKHFKKLGKIHENLKLEYWVNIENFTWDRGTNNHYSSLIPAEFGRYLEQIVSASMSGAKRIASFSVYGIIDKPGERHPLGQPVEANRTYETYKNWLAGDPHWKMLEGIFSGTVKNDAKGCPVSYEINGLPSKELTAQQEYLCGLTDGYVADTNPSADGWVRFMKSGSVIMDLGKEQNVSVVAPRFLNYSPFKYEMPVTVELYTSLDGIDWTLVGSQPGPHNVNNRHDCWTDISYFAEVGNARYLKMSCVAPNSSARISCDEIFVKY